MAGLGYGSDDTSVNLGQVEALLAAVREAIGPRGKVYFGTFPSEGATPLDAASAAVPAGTVRLAATLRGEDDAGRVVAVGELAVAGHR